jgi:prepilin-type N-terminal cleavage/methylation domain-containing protein
MDPGENFLDVLCPYKVNTDMVPPTPAKNRYRRAFSLTELLVVISVIVILMALVVPAVSNFGKATNLVTSGNMVANLAGYARQLAITKSTLTALILLGAQGTEDDYRAFTILEYNATTGWSQATAWQKLPVGIVVDRTGENAISDIENGTFLKNSPTSFLPAASQKEPPVPPVRYENKQVTRFAGRIFTASGSLLNPEAPAELRLVEGFIQGGRVIPTRPGAKGAFVNYYSIALLGATGIARVEHP